MKDFHNVTFISPDGKITGAMRRNNPDGSLGGWVAENAVVDPSAVVELDALVEPGAIVQAGARVTNGQVVKSLEVHYPT